jgi:hypothetical protein
MDGDTITDKANSIAEKAKLAAENQKKAGADQLGRMAEAVHRAGDALLEELPGTAAYAEEAARSLERTAMSVRERSIDDLLRDGSEFARREPALVFAGAALAGFALSRFFVSSGRGHNERLARSNHARPKI